MLVDSHCHLNRLDLSEFGGDFAAFLDRLAAARVARLLAVSVTLADYPELRALKSGAAAIDLSVGVHPAELPEDEPTAEVLIALASDQRVVALGETGLDYHWDACPRDVQQARFRSHIRAARHLGKPLVVHCRDAADDTIRLLKEEGAGQVGGVFHCFTGDWAQAEQVLDLGFYISFSGIVTFKSARELQEVASKVPSDRYLIETDAPYLAPVPFRGKPNFPYLVQHVADKIAMIRGVDAAHVEDETSANYFELFATPLA